MIDLPIKPLVIAPYKPSNDDERRAWTGEQAFEKFAAAREKNKTVHQKRGFGKRENKNGRN